MDAQDSYRPNCHRCHEVMALHSQEIVHGQTMNIFRCERCHILEAEDVSHNWIAVKQQTLLVRSLII
jgi:hypothetical protein